MIMHRPNSPRADEFVSPRTSARRGLTVIELLLTLITLSIFTGVLASGLTRERENDRTTHCLKNLKTITQAAQTYADNDPDNILGPIHPYASHFYGEGFADYGGGPGTMNGPGNFNYFGWGHEMDPRSRSFNQLLYGLEPGETISPLSAPGDPTYFKEFHCPGWDLGWQDWPNFGSSPLETESSYFKGNGTSYRMNNLSSDYDNSIGFYGRAGNQIPVPGQTISFLEARVFQSIFTNDTWGSLQQGELTGYHEKAGFFTVAYSDGHAKFADFGDGTYYQHIDWSPHTEWNETDARGTWGRMDCFPELPIGEPVLLQRSSSRLDSQNISMKRADR